MIARLFRNYNVKIAYRTNNTISNYLRVKNGKPDKLESSGIYELKCKSCPRKYIGQTGRNFKTRYREHMLAIRNNNSAASKYAQHILETGHEYGKMEDILTIMQCERKGRRLNSLEQFYIHRLVKEETQLNDTHKNTHNPIFDLIHEHDNNSKPTHSYTTRNTSLNLPQQHTPPTPRHHMTTHQYSIRKHYTLTV
jgi:hypothetical protein